MPYAALIDSGPLVAAAARRDRHHSAAIAFLEGFRAPLLTTWAVLVEACHLMPRHAVVPFLQWVSAGGVGVAEMPPAAVGPMAELMRRYADLPMDLADASLVWLADELGIQDVVTFDRRDFAVYRLADGRRFRNLFVARNR
jgi:uncharacterized protein